MDLSRAAEDILLAVYNGTPLLRGTRLALPIYWLGEREMPANDVERLFIAGYLDYGEGTAAEGERIPCRITAEGRAEAQRIKGERESR